MIKDPFATGVRGQESIRLMPDFGESVVCIAAEDMARQEYAIQCDLAYQVQRFGAGLPFQNGSVDFDALDLTRAMEIVEQAQLAWLELPKVVRDRYQSWANVERAAQSGELQQLLKAAGAEAGGSASAPAASPSASAAVDAPKAS